MCAQRFKPLHILITAGPTHEYIDSVRYLTNGSSGRMGYACAEDAVRRGHRVTLISGPVELPAPRGVHRISIVSAAEMAKAVLEVFPDCDAVIMAAAVADYHPAQTFVHKMTKTAGPLTLQLIQTQDILAELGRRKVKQILIGFAVQDKAARQNARRKLKDKNLDAIILNRPNAIGSDQNTIEILQPGHPWKTLPTQSKIRLARHIVALAETIQRTHSDR